MAELTKRPRYFDRQLLGEEDFTLAQSYAISRRRLHNRLLHTWGIAEGLTLSFAPNASVATVGPGSGIDSLGQEIVVVAPTPTPDVTGLAGKTVYVWATYNESASDPRTAAGLTDNARYSEAPLIRLGETPPTPAGAQLILGRLTVAATGKIVALDDGSAPNNRRFAGAAGGALFVDQPGVNDGALQPGVVFGGATSGEGIASRRTVGGNRWGLDFFAGGSSRLSITNAGNVGIGTAAPGARLHVTGGDAYFSGNAIVGQGGNGSLRVRNIDGKSYSTDDYDALYLNWATGKPVSLGRSDIPSGLIVWGDGNFQSFPPNDTTPSNARLSLSNRSAGGGTLSWTMQSAAVGGGWGVTPNSFEIWEYPASASRFQLRPGGNTILTPVAGNVGIGTASPQARLHIANGDLRLDGAHTISAAGRLHIAGDEILYLLNRNGVVVSRAWGGSGDLTVEGRIGVNGQSPVPRTAGWGGGIHTWDLEVEGSAWCRNGWASGPRDLAENFDAEGVLEAGDVVAFHAEHDAITLADAPNDVLVCGVVSTAPGVLLNFDPDRRDEVARVPVALCGRVPCKVVDENGPIRRGDLLTSSSVPGHAMRAIPVELDGQRVYRAGTIVGKALTSHAKGCGMIEVFVSPS